MKTNQSALILDPDPPVLVIAPQDHEKDEQSTTGKPDSASQLILGLIFGIIFGFLLQKGGAAKYEVLIGQFLLTDFTVIKVMLTAIVVGMVGIFSMHAPVPERRPWGRVTTMRSPVSWG